MSESLICNGDCACSKYCSTLAIDTSHVCFLGRVSAKGDDAAAEFVELIELHRCGGARRLVTSAALMELELNLADAGCHVRRFNEAVPLDGLDSLEALATDPDEAQRLRELDCDSPDLTGATKLDERDSTLVLAAELTGDDVALVSDDEHLLDWQREMVMRGEVKALPTHVLELFAGMVSCCAVSAEAFLRAAEAEGARYEEELQGASMWILERKRDRLIRLTNAVAVATDPGAS